MWYVLAIMFSTVAVTIGTTAAEMLTKAGLQRAGAWVKKFYKKDLNIEDIKKKTKILFVDDEDFARIATLRAAGWNVQQINDVSNYDATEIKSADIIFMDYVGVGKGLSAEQGIGLLKSIKKRYPEKFLVFYSGHAGFIPGHEVHSIADAWIDKHADAQVYIDQIEAAALHVHAS